MEHVFESVVLNPIMGLFLENCGLLFFSWEKSLREYFSRIAVFVFSSREKMSTRLLLENRRLCFFSREQSLQGYFSRIAVSRSSRENKKRRKNESASLPWWQVSNVEIPDLPQSVHYKCKVEINGFLSRNGKKCFQRETFFSFSGSFSAGSTIQTSSWV